MFTGIIEEIGIVKHIEQEKGNMILTIKSSFSHELNINQSLSHNGICLSVSSFNKSQYTICAIEETITKTNLNSIQPGHLVNLERCLLIGDRLDGHFVQGHIDCTMKCNQIRETNGSWLFQFQCQDKHMKYLCPKGSIAINGISLTISQINDQEKTFQVAVIPYTFNHTNFKEIKIGENVNIEFDIISKQLLRINR